MRCRGGNQWFTGKIAAIRGDRLYDILYDDGESEARVAESLIRRWVSTPHTGTPASARPTERARADAAEAEAKAAEERRQRLAAEAQAAEAERKLRAAEAAAEEKKRREAAAAAEAERRRRAEAKAAEEKRRREALVRTLEGHSESVRCSVRMLYYFVMTCLCRRSSALQCFRTGDASCLGGTTARSRCGTWRPANAWRRWKGIRVTCVPRRPLYICDDPASL